MAIREIVKVGHPVLRKKAAPVSKITKQLRKLVRDMQATMEEAAGVGLAAPQVGVSLRLIVVAVGEENLVLFNPQIIEETGEDIDVEGCLSIPGLNGYVKRAAQVTVIGYDERGKKVTLTAEGLLARALQHEIDHLDGILFVDRLIDPPEEEEEDQCE
ncbi:MAG: peptide deformylase [Limnochordia bacterium]|jgi:peptide deformylase